jgi:histidinol-phosphate aminotransferase
MAYERASIERMQGYVPGKQPTSSDTIKLNTNENPYPPAASVLEALRAITPDALRRYPEPLAAGFRSASAALHGLAPNQLVAVNGGDELLRLAVTTFVEPGAPIGVLSPSYSLYPVLAAIHGSPVVSLPANSDFSVPAELAAHMNSCGVNLCLLVNPHAPSGHLTSRAQLSAIARDLKGVLLIDEAYVDFVDPQLQHDLVPLLAQHDNVLLLRTLSKGYSLDGLRFGYGMGCAELIAPLLGKTRDSYNVDVIAQQLATAAISDQASARRTWQQVQSERAHVTSQLRALGFDVPDSQSNFVLAERSTPDPNALELQRALEGRGILVRHFAEPRLEQALRITIGTPEQNARLLHELRQLL